MVNIFLGMAWIIITISVPLQYLSGNEDIYSAVVIHVLLTIYFAFLFHSKKKSR